MPDRSLDGTEELHVAVISGPYCLPERDERATPRGGGAMLTLERMWDRRVEQWHSHVTSAAAFENVLSNLIQLASPKPTDACVDLGAGTGFVTTAMAPLVSSVLAVDISSA